MRVLGVSSMIDKAYLKQRAALINASGNSMGTASAGNLGDIPLGVDKTIEHGTTHFSIVDAKGKLIGQVGEGNRKDIRNAVAAATH
mgnify:CR=1 FL=1